MLPDWPHLKTLASEEVQKTIQALPRQLRAKAKGLPVTYELTPSAALIADGLESDTLGLFVGGDHDEEDHSVIPPQIILYLENLWLLIEEEGGGEAEFREEVRTTLLHELGHYLGLDEDDLEERGLE
jgi:predicted Zn-dependent protease with MMP-like domain